MVSQPWYFIKLFYVPIRVICWILTLPCSEEGRNFYEWKGLCEYVHASSMFWKPPRRA